MGKSRKKKTKENTDKSKSNQNASAASVSTEKLDVKSNASKLNPDYKKMNIATNNAADFKKDDSQSDADRSSENEHLVKGKLKQINEASPIEVTSHQHKKHNKPDRDRLTDDNTSNKYDRYSKSKNQMSQQYDWYDQKPSKDENLWSSPASKGPHDGSNNKQVYGQGCMNTHRHKEDQKKHTSKERQRTLDEYCPNEGNQSYSTKFNKMQQYAQSSETGSNSRSRRNDADRHNRIKFRNRSNSRRKVDGYDKFDEFYNLNKNIQYHIVHEIDGDLFTAGTDYSLGHCVAEDMKMGSGIAVSFRRDFKRVDELLDQRKTQGNVAVLEDQGRYIYYLVTKRASTGKPTYQTLWLSLQKMKDHIITNSVKKIALPRIGCGLDGLEWSVVKAMLEYTFTDLDIEIKIYNFQKDEDAPVSSYKPRKCWVVNYPKPLTEIEYGTIMIYFLSEDAIQNDETKSLYFKFPFLRFSERDSASKTLGHFVHTHRNDYNFYGCIVRKSHKDLFSFQSFQRCLNSIQSENRKQKYEYIAFQAFLEDESSLIVEKIANLISHSMTNVHVYVCWPENLSTFMPYSQHSAQSTTQ